MGNDPDDGLMEPTGRDLMDRAAAYARAYADGVAGRRVFPTAEDMAALAAFDEALPEGSSDPAAMLDLLHEVGSPATVAQTGGRYFGFVNGGALPAALAAKRLADAWDQNAALAVMSPTVAKLEEVCEAWLRDLLGLPPGTVAGFVSGTSLSLVCGLAAARHRILSDQGWDVNRQGLAGAPPLRVVATGSAHASVTKAVALLGLGTDRIEWIPADKQGRAQVDRLPRLDARTMVLLQAGNVNTGAFDPIDAICDRATEAGAWVHVDGAFGLWAAACARLRHLTRGLEKAHSWSVDAHKTLNAPYDAGLILCRDAEALAGALQAQGAYLTFGDGRDGMHYTPEMSRRARAVELWAILKVLGRSGVDALVTGLHDRAVQMAGLLAADGFKVLNDVVFNQVLVRAGEDQTTAQVLGKVQSSGECWAGGTTWQGRAAIRISICSWATTEEDIARAARAFSTAREEVLSPPGASQAAG